MSRSIESQLSEAYRDVLVAYYLAEVVPNHRPFIELGLNTRLITANDLYEYLLLDNQVSHDVQSSPVASAIASVQHYINASLMGMEPGYDALRPDEAQFVEWRDRSSQYPIWAANQQLALYPEVYISPDLRIKKSTYFAQLENDVNQNKITLDSVQDAVSAYLANFEEVANVSLINGYIDSDLFAEGNYYFIGKSRAEKQYYWREVNMNERAYLSGTEGPKLDYPTPGAWSDWQKANIAVTDNTLERTLRPVYFNNRLFVTWVDLIPVAEELSINIPIPAGDPPYATPPVSGQASVVVSTPYVKLLFNISYKKYDGSWSAPQTYIDITTAKQISVGDDKFNLETDLDTVATYDISSTPESMFIALYAGAQPKTEDPEGTTASYALLHTRFIDKNFNVSVAFPSAGQVNAQASSAVAEATESRVRKVMSMQAINNKGRFQFLANIRLTLKHHETTSPPDWNYNAWQTSVARVNAELDLVASTIKVSTSISGQLPPPNAPKPSETITITDLVNKNLLTLKYSYVVGTITTLEEGSFYYMEANTAGDKDLAITINFKVAGLTPFILLPIMDENGEELVRVPPHPGNRFDLKGKTVFNASLDLLRLSTPLPELPTMCVIETPFYSTIGMIKRTDFLRPQLLREVYVPRDMNAPTTTALIALAPPSEYGPELLPPSPMEVNISFDKASLHLNTPNLTPHKTTPGLFYVAHGVLIREIRADLTWRDLGYALKLEQFELMLTTARSDGPLVAPKISKFEHASLGIAEFIDFTGSTIAKNDSGDADRHPIRMNTLFARELINKANIALEALLSWDTQLLPEPPMGALSPSGPMDFNGANGLYFWELFLHLPFMVAHRLNLERQLDESAFWLGFVFDPSRKASGKAPDYWNVRPLTETSDPDHFMRSPIDPDGIAASNPVIYRKAIYFHFIKNLIDRGDAAYRQLTPDSLNEAKLWYVRVLDLLGPRPDSNIVSRWTPATLDAVANASNSELRALEARLQDEANRRSNLAADALPTLRLSTCGRDPTLDDVDNGSFVPPFNADLVKHWDTLESRLYNLRHNFTIDGKPLSLPLFAAPLDPRALLASYAAGHVGAAAGSLLAQEVPHHRYAVMFNRASAAVEALIQFANTLFLHLERKDQAIQVELQQAQIWELAQFAIDVQLETQKVEEASRRALETSLVLAEDRHGYYAKLANENISPGEVAAMALHGIARTAHGASMIATGVAAAAKVLPNHAGFHAGATGGMAVGAAVGGAVGGFRLEGIPETVAIASQAIAILSDTAADALDRTETYRRRLQEWEHQRDQAEREIDQIKAQLGVHDAQKRVTVVHLDQARQAKDQAEKMYAFLKNQRFTNSQLYLWVSGQLSTLYYQAYDVTLSLCMAAQSCWQFELGDYRSSFIQPAAWKDDYKGLTAGETLKLNLMKMDAAWLNRHERGLEIVKTVSVRQLPPSTDDAPTLNKPWDEVAARLNEDGVADFEITQAMLDADYPGHTLRRIKRLSLSLPVTVGAYQDIRATLTQTYNAVQIDGVLKENMRASQQIAISTGIDDDGLFVFNFDDDRYLPFEGTGVISRWTLSFPTPNLQSDMIASITDIILHIRYTAKSGPIVSDTGDQQRLRADR